MTVTVHIPDDLAGALAGSGQDPERAVLEAVAIEGYRTERLSESAVRRLLGYETRMQVHGFLKEHGVFLHYGLEDLDHDMREADRIVGLKDSACSTEHRPA
jgi:predicted HTH domain antitoxin